MNIIDDQIAIKYGVFHGELIFTGNSAIFCFQVFLGFNVDHFHFPSLQLLSQESSCFWWKPWTFFNVFFFMQIFAFIF
jgi:hypothetical protein